MSRTVAVVAAAMALATGSGLAAATDEANPNGLFADWRPNPSCRGNGDQGG